ncbi:unnamed protein product [Plutella xylostella]|uniref:(diamondback moth) hypothetical protein n=1 Tax=Plutella xylostella TaxID=51655 RepID=A0A8S4GBD9_PLUXY|nr:unnamed protein product [Plutella xylostella]
MIIDSLLKTNELDPKSKFVKDVTIDDITLDAFVDLGSEVTLVKKSVVERLGVKYDDVTSLMKGFGNGVVKSLGTLWLNMSIDGVEAHVACMVVNDDLLEKSFLVGHTYTEQPHILVYKNSKQLKFYHFDSEMPRPDTDISDDSLLTVKTNSVVQIHGAASVRLQVDTNYTGSVLLKSSYAGKPNRQYFLSGGLYHCKNGQINVTVSPCSETCLFPEGSVLCRVEKVHYVNRVSVEAARIHETFERDFDEKLVRVNESVTADIKKRLMELLIKYKHCFATSLKDLGCTNTTEMNIELNSQNPVVYRPYRLSHHEREKVRSMVNEMIDAGIIRESVSEYSSPIILVRKKDGSSRLCVDYRMLNSITIKERYPMPVIEDEIARLSGQACFITLDLASGYYQVPIAEQSKHLTSFVTPDGQYEFNRMPFGLANAPAVFQRMLNKILGTARFNHATAYIDDVLIYGKDAMECLERLEEVLQAMHKANLTLNLSKCDFLRSSIDYLGYEISADGVRPGQRKITSVLNFPRPENVHNVRQFLGLASYFRKFIQGFSQIAFPLSKLLKKDAGWEWSSSQEKAFEDLKARLVDRPILAIYDPNAETELHTDASKIGVGGILLQRCSANDAFRPVAYYSRQTSPEEKNFHSYELETLAVVCSLRKFRIYLLGKKFKIITDCSALRSTFSKRDLIPRVARWWLLFQEFDCSVEYRSGTKMSHVDALSRNPVSDMEETLADRFPMVMSICGEDWLHTLQLGDSELNRIRDILKNNVDEKGLQYIRDNYVIKGDKLYRYLDSDKN